MEEDSIPIDSKARPGVEHLSGRQFATVRQCESDPVEALIDEIEEEQGLAGEWDDELIRRSQMLHIKLQGGETDRREVAIVHKAGVILKALRQGQKISAESVAEHLGVEPGFIAFLENGLVSLDEAYPKLRDPLAAALDLDPRIVDLIFEAS